MFDISKNKIITVNRGDSFEFNLMVNQGTVLNEVAYTMAENDKVYFALMEPNQKFEDALIVKIYTKEDQWSNGEITVHFDASDTENLHPGLYYYQVKLRTITENSDDEVTTVIGKTKFILLD